ncbi:MAG: beta-lactamase family protein [Scytonematopsis contorta HA4267-MV1]|jgi:D-alanyl-D-alanine carboxypeptidase|nr:beta-lactamase family protein [Scytonematopsis contorta HA4267-MV1]
MRHKNFTKSKVLLITFVLFCQGAIGYLELHSLSERATGQPLPLPFLPQPEEVVPTEIPQMESQTKLQSVLDEAVNKQQSPGAVLYISTPDGTWAGASGVSNLARKTPMKPTDGFSIASTSKTFVAVVVLQLAAEGKLNLDRPIAKYLSESISSSIPNSKNITVRQLLNHTSGVAEYLNTDAFKKATASRGRSKPWTAKEAIKYMYGVKPKALPGERFAYTDTNYILLELIVEQITKGTLAEAIRNRILEPLSLKNTFTELHEPTKGDVATGYSRPNKNGKRNSFEDVNDGNGLGDGGLVSTGEDLGKFMQALFGDKTLLPPNMMAEMLKFPDRDYAYGLGVERIKTPFGMALGHSGIAYGFRTQMLYFPNQKSSVVVLVNDQGVDAKAITMKALSVVFRS